MINNPIFIGGTGRSGTSMLTKILSQDRDILYFGEKVNSLFSILFNNGQSIIFDLEYE